MKLILEGLCAGMAVAAALPLRGEMLGFWDFRDGAPGEEVVTIVNSLGSDTFTGTSGRPYDKGTLPKFASDGPGCIVKSRQDTTILSRNPQSLAFRYEDRAGSRLSGFVDIAGVADQLVGKGSFTIECFVKMDENYLYYMEGDGNYDQISKTVLYLGARAEAGGFKLVAPRYRFTNGHAQGFSQQVFARTDIVAGSEVSTWDDTSDGKWHHLAAVYTETNDVAKCGTLTFYVDYVQIDNPVAYVNDTDGEAGVKLRLGTGYKNGAGSDVSWECIHASIAALRVSTGALAVADFEMVARETVFHFAFEEGADGATISSAEEANGVTECNTADLYHIFDDDAPLYDRRDRQQGNSLIGRRITGADYLLKNTGIAYFRGYAALADGTSLRQYAGHEIAVPASSNPAQNPSSWTMEAFVKGEHEYGDALIFGKYGNAKPHKNSYPKCSWMLTWHDGRLAVTWVEPTADGAFTAETASANTHRVETTAAYLRDKCWHHVALTYSAATHTFCLYVDGAEALRAVTGEAGLLDGPWGYYFSRMEPTTGFQGWMDEIRFSTGVRSVADFLTVQPAGSCIILR